MISQWLPARKLTHLWSLFETRQQTAGYVAGRHRFTGHPSVSGLMCHICARRSGMSPSAVWWDIRKIKRARVPSTVACNSGKERMLKLWMGRNLKIC